jgi:hypothetical protein
LFTKYFLLQSFEEFGVARRIKLSSEIYCSVNFNAPGPKKPDPTKGKHFMRWLKEGLAAGTNLLYSFGLNFQ